MLLATSLVTGTILVAWSVLSSTVSVYLPPDGAHYIADADALLGRGVRELRHPPLFPALVAGAQLLVGDVQSFQVAMGLSLGLLSLALYGLLRRWVGRGPSYLGAATGVLMPTTAEILGWGGGATLLGIACLVLSLGALETWIARWRLGGLLVGAALGLTALAHPFVFGLAVAVVGVRWLILLAERRRLGLGWDPHGLRGMGLVLLPLVPSLLTAAPYYPSLEGGGGFGLQVPRLAGLAEMLGWALERNPLVWLLVAVGVLAPFASERKGPGAYVGCVSALAIVMATSLAADPSYVSRIAYLFPVIVATGVGTAGERLQGKWISRIPHSRALARVAATLLVLAMAASAFGPRLERASRFYQLLEPEDVQALEGLGHGAGVVATSWHGPDYGSGVATSWFVEGLSKRRGFGPTEPWGSTVPEQAAVGQDMQRLFAGTEGIENGALQLAAGPPGVRADPALQVFSDGFYFPVLYMNSLVNTYATGFEGGSEREMDGEVLRLTFWDATGRPVLRQEARLAGREVMIRYELDPRLDPGAWSLWLWPAYGVHWKDVRTGGGWVEARQELREEDIGFRVSADEAEVVYHPVEPRFRVEAIEVRAEHAANVTVHLKVDVQATPGAVELFDEREILARHDITEVIVWRDTGWRDRFDRAACYLLIRETASLLIYGVRDDSCPGGTSL